MNIQMKTTLITALGAIITTFGIAQGIAISVNAQTITGESVTMQKTQTSVPDPLKGHSGHQAVLVLAPRSDGKVWVGTITWTASNPVEIVVLHMYNSSVTTDAAHGKPLTAPSPVGQGEVAITLYKVPSNSPLNSGSTNFAGNALAFHNLNGTKFTVTYTVDATAKQLTK
jgi:hypothetical protein